MPFFIIHHFDSIKYYPTGSLYQYSAVYIQGHTLEVIVSNVTGILVNSGKVPYAIDNNQVSVDTLYFRSAACIRLAIRVTFLLNTHKRHLIIRPRHGTNLVNPLHQICSTLVIYALYAISYTVWRWYNETHQHHFWHQDFCGFVISRKPCIAYNTRNNILMHCTLN